MEGLFGWVVIAVIVIILLNAFIHPILAGIYWLLMIISTWCFIFLEWWCSARVLPYCGWVLWMFWGAMIGAAWAFWTLAPVYGLRAWRPLIALAPFLLMTLIAIVASLAG